MERSVGPFPILRSYARLLRFGAWVAVFVEVLIGLGIGSVFATTAGTLGAAVTFGTVLVALVKAALYWLAFMILAELLELALAVEENTRRTAER